MAPRARKVGEHERKSLVLKCEMFQIVADGSKEASGDRFSPGSFDLPEKTILSLSPISGNYFPLEKM